ncbi:MAG: hypothetical protein OXH83_00395, partial [Bryobacterales bacterium]|nr:hypothetical protein [Bryobacterales bacterium]
AELNLSETASIRTKKCSWYFRLQSDETEESLIEGQVAASLGLSVDLVQRLSIALANSQPDADANIPEWRKWFFRWLMANPDLLEKAFRKQNLTELFGNSAYNACDSEQGKADLVLPVLRTLTRLWMKGRPLRDLELAFGTDTAKLNFCENARRFAIRIVPDISYLFGLPALLRERSRSRRDDQIVTPPVVAQLGQCTRIGLNSLEQAALNQVLGSAEVSRRQIHRRYAQIKPRLELGSKNETWDGVVARIQRAIIHHTP